MAEWQIIEFDDGWCRVLQQDDPPQDFGLFRTRQLADAFVSDGKLEPRVARSQSDG